MRFVWFNLMPWPYLPENFREKYRSVWVDIPSALYDPVRGHEVYNTYLDQLEFADSVGFDGLGVLNWRWLVGAIVLLANWPYTLFVIAPTNKRLMDTVPEAATDETRRMLEWWGALHARRSALGLIATLVFLWAQR